MNAVLVVGILLGTVVTGWSVYLVWRLRDVRLVVVTALAALLTLQATLFLTSTERPSAWIVLVTTVSVGILLGLLRHLHAEREAAEETWRAGAERYRSMVDRSPDGVAIVVDNSVSYINPAGAELLGAAGPDELLGRSLLEFVSDADRVRLEAWTSEVIHKGSTVPSLEQTWVRVDGAPVRVELRGAPMSYSDREGVLVMMRDVSARTRAESRLQMLEAAIQQANEAVVLVDVGEAGSQGGVVLYVNEAFTRLTGYAPEEALGTPFLQLLGTRPGSAAYRQFLQAFSTVEPVRVEFLNRHRDGNSFWVECDLTPIFDENKEPVHWVCIQRDISRRKQAEAQLRAQAALLQEAQDAIYVRDLDGYIQYWNKSAERLYGWKTAEALDQDVDSLLYRTGEPRLREALETTLIEGKWTGELTPVSRAGKQLTVSSRWTLVPGAAGQSKCILVVNTDITDKKKLESQLMRAQRLESIGRLASGIAHDLNNVLNPIMMACGLLTAEPLTDEARELVSTIELSAQRGTDVLKQVLTFARGAAGEQQIIQPAEIIRDIERLIRETFPRSIQIQTDVSKELWTVKGNRTQLEQVLMNLCVNARDAMSEGGILTITADNHVVSDESARKHLDARPGPHVVIAVSDTGLGIPEEELDKIFEPFYTTKQQGEGTGLGLSTVLSIVQSEDGFLHVHSRPGEGSTFVIFLPAVEAAKPQPVLPRPPKTRQGRGELILLVDDEDDIRSLGRKMLEQHGYRAITASDGHAAIDVYRRRHHEISAVITDVMMPRMDGLEMIRTLLEINPKAKILVSSGYVSDQSVIKMAESGAHVFLPKPYNAHQLLVALQRLFSMEERVAAS